MTIISNLSTHELQAGDVVLRYGMRVLLPGDGEVSHSHSLDGPGAPCLWWDGEILNVDEVLADGFVPRGFMHDGRWTIQGNGLARWTIERK